MFVCDTGQQGIMLLDVDDNHMNDKELKNQGMDWTSANSGDAEVGAYSQLLNAVVVLQTSWIHELCLLTMRGH